MNFYFNTLYLYNVMEIKEMKKMPKNNYIFKSEMIILLSLLDEDNYTYELSKKISQLTNGVYNMSGGVIYPVLKGCLEKEYVSTRLVKANRKLRVYYHLEESGKEHLKGLVHEYHISSHAINNLIDNYNEYLDDEE